MSTSQRVRSWNALGLAFASFFAVGFFAPGLATTALASSSDALIVVGADHSGRIVDQLNARLAIIAAVQNLSPLYASTDILDDASVTASRLAEAIRERSGFRNIDVLVLSREPELAPITRRMRNLRLIYLSGEASLTLARRWRAAGAKLVVAQADFTRSSSLSSERFIMRWAQGWGALKAAKDARAYAQSHREILGRAATIETREGFAITGEDLNQAGEELGAVFHSELGPEPARENDFAWVAPARVARSAIETAVLAASTSLVPAVTVKTEQLPGAQDFLGQAGPMAWGQLENLFASGQSEVPTVDTDPLAREVWVDGEFLQYVATPVQGYLGGTFANALRYLQGVKLDRTPTHLEISVYFSQAFDIQLNEPSAVPEFRLYAVHIPKTVRVSIASGGGAITLTGLDNGQGPSDDRIFLDVKVPLVSTKVYLRSTTVQLTSGDMIAEAGILGDTIGLIADAKIFAAKIQPKLDLWKSIEDNLSLFDWPVLTFAQGNL